MNVNTSTQTKLYEEIISKIDYSRELDTEELRERIDQIVLQESKKLPMGIREMQKLRQDLYAKIRELDIVQELIDDPEVTEIMVNGLDPVFVEKNGELHETDIRFETEEKLLQIIQQIVGACNRTVNEASPIVDARLTNGSRVNVVLPPVALNGPILTIRRFPDHPFTMEQMIRENSISGQAAAFLGRLVTAGYNILVSGGTGSGKTTFLNALSVYIPKTERVLVIEDSSELQIQNISNLVRLETRNGNVEGCRPVSIRDLIKTSLRMRPDRVIIGEVRGSETIDMLQALNTGHSCMTTCHANTARDVISRLETMVLMGMELPVSAIRRQIASAIDIVVQLGRLRDKSRHVLEIAEIVGFQQDEVQLATLYLFEEESGDVTNQCKVKGELVKKGELQHVQKLTAAGIEKEEGKE